MFVCMLTLVVLLQYICAGHIYIYAGNLVWGENSPQVPFAPTRFEVNCCPPPPHPQGRLMSFQCMRVNQYDPL